MADTIVYRRLWRFDLERCIEHFLALDLDERRQRFMHAVSDDYVKSYLRKLLDPIKLTTGEHVVIGAFLQGRLIGIGELCVDGPSARTAEAAFTVKKIARRRGIGASLFRRVLLSAQNKRIESVYIACIPSNEAMRRLAKQHGVTLSFEVDEIAGCVEISEPSYLTLVREIIGESFGIVAYAWSSPPGTVRKLVSQPADMSSRS